MRVPPTARATGTVKISQNCVAGTSFMYSKNKFEIVSVHIFLFVVVGALDRNVSSTNERNRPRHMCVRAAHECGRAAKRKIIDKTNQNFRIWETCTRNKPIAGVRTPQRNETKTMELHRR